MRLRSSKSTFFVTAVFLLLTLTLTLAAPAPGADPVLGSAGIYEVRLTGPISSDSTPNAPIAAQVITPQNLAGAMLEGKILKASSSGVLKKKSELSFKFDTLYFNNQKYGIDGRVVSYYNSKGEKDRDEEGFIVKSSDPAKNALIGAGIGAGLGALIGNQTSKSGNKSKDTMKGAGAGAAVGVAAGLALAMTAKAPKIQFDTGSKFDLDVKPTRMVAQ